jgi:uncharacterized protein
MKTESSQEWAIVTGASSGIGVSFATQLADRGYAVLLVARRAAELERVAEEIRQRGGRADTLTADLATPEGIGLVVGVVERRGAPAVLVNNAGLGGYGAFIEQPPESQTAQIALNIGALVGLSRAIVPLMVARKRGQIINLASVLAFMPVPYFATYAATKSFVLSFSEALSHELRGTGVQVLASCPGVTTTGFASAASWEGEGGALPRLSPDAVARASLHAATRGGVVRVVGAASRLLAFLSRVTPRAIMRRIMGAVFSPPASGGATGRISRSPS